MPRMRGLTKHCIGVQGLLFRGDVVWLGQGVWVGMWFVLRVVIMGCFWQWSNLVWGGAGRVGACAIGWAYFDCCSQGLISWRRLFSN